MYLRNILTIIGLLVILSTISDKAFAGSYIEIVNGYVRSSCRYVNEDGDRAYNEPNEHHIGRDNGSNGVNGNSNSDIYRSVYTFDLQDLDDDVTITSVSLKIQTGYFENPYQMTIRKYEDNPVSQNSQEVWSDVNSGTIYYDNVDYGYSEMSANGDLKTAVQNNLSNDQIHIGIHSKAEGTNLSYCDDISLTLRINYIDIVDVTVVNSFGGGSFKVDGTEYQHNKTFRWNEEEIHVFENGDQTYEDVQYVFQNKWTNTNTSQVYTGNPASISFSSDATLRAEFEEKIHITVKNRHNGGQLKVDNEPYDSGAEFDFAKNSLHDFEAWEQFYGGYDMKFKDGDKWDMTENNYSTAIVQNHSVITEGDYIAQLWQQYNYTADNVFINGGSGGTIIVNNDSKTIPAPDPYSGNTLEADPFTVEAPQQTRTVNGRDITYNFLEWENGSTENPRTMSPNGHFDIMATYKGHLASSEARATGYNNGRRVARESSDILHMVYEDNGEIWYTKTTDNGNTWSAEQRISDAKIEQTGYSQYATRPSVFFNANNVLNVIWEEVIVDGGEEGHGIKLRHKTTSWQTPFYVFDIGNAFEGYNDYRYPAIVRQSGDIYDPYLLNVICRRQSDNRVMISSSGNAFATIAAVPGAYGIPTGDASLNNAVIHLVWPNNDDIKHIKGTWTGSAWSWSGVSNLTSNMPYYTYGFTNPSLSFVNTTGDGHLTWEGENWAIIGKEIHYQKFDFSGGSPVEIGNRTEIAHAEGEYLGDAVNSYFYDDDVLSVFYEKAGAIYRKKKTSSGWTTKSFSGGKYPSIARYTSSGAVWTKYSSAPFILETDYEIQSGGRDPGPGLGKGMDGADQDSLAEKPLTVNKRFGYAFNDDPSRPEVLFLTLKSTTVNEISVEFSDNNKGNALQFSGSDDIRMDWAVIKNNLPDEIPSSTPLLDIFLVEGGQKTLLEHYTLSDFQGGSEEEAITTSFLYSALDDANGHLEIVFPETQPHITNLLQEVEESDGLNKGIFSSVDTRHIPSQYELSQNYPNPFNPVTHISFGLPQRSVAKLSVYNMKGQVVAELVNGNFEAGSYEVVFNANGLASGVYIYHLQAGTFRKSGRMLLIK